MTVPEVAFVVARQRKQGWQQRKGEGKWEPDAGMPSGALF